eukprot:3773548-Rhodomonas_salina.1
MPPSSAANCSGAASDELAPTCQVHPLSAARDLPRDSSARSDSFSLASGNWAEHMRERAAAMVIFHVVADLGVVAWMR